jgi:uncharacterized membrane protein YtjA (UPF0391 family)
MGAQRAAQFPQFNYDLARRKQRLCLRLFPEPRRNGGSTMLRWALIFFVVALMAAVFGFTGIALAAAGVAKILFYLFVILFVLSLLGHVARRP